MVRVRVGGISFPFRLRGLPFRLRTFSNFLELRNPPFQMEVRVAGSLAGCWWGVGGRPWPRQCVSRRVGALINQSLLPCVNYTMDGIVWKRSGLGI